MYGRSDSLAFFLIVSMSCYWSQLPCWWFHLSVVVIVDAVAIVVTFFWVITELSFFICSMWAEQQWISRSLLGFLYHTGTTHPGHEPQPVPVIEAILSLCESAKETLLWIWSLHHHDSKIPLTTWVGLLHQLLLIYVELVCIFDYDFTCLVAVAKNVTSLEILVFWDFVRNLSSPRNVKMSDL